MCGRFNVSNLLAVAAVLIAAGLKPKAVAARFALLPPPPGRLEKTGGDNEPPIVVDYVYTLDALENALHALRAVHKRVVPALSPYLAVVVIAIAASAP